MKKSVKSFISSSNNYLSEKFPILGVIS